MGGLNTVAGVLIYWAMLLLVNYVVAYLLAFAIGIILSNVLHSKFVFDTPVRMANTIPLAVWYAISAALGSGLLVLLVRGGVASRELAILLVAAVMAPLSYVAVKLILTRQPENQTPQ
jgi:putative flippase GtrA